MDTPGGLSARAQHRKFYASLTGELIAWARHQFELDALDKNGATARQHLAGALQRARTGERRRALETELAGPPFPHPLRYLWTLFVEISDGLDGGGWGPSVISWQSLAAWSQLTGISLEPREALALVHLGATRAAVISKIKDD